MKVVREVVRDEVMGTLKIRGGKSAGMDGIAVELLKNGAISIID